MKPPDFNFKTSQINPFVPSSSFQLGFSDFVPSWKMSSGVLSLGGVTKQNMSVVLQISTASLIWRCGSFFNEARLLRWKWSMLWACQCRNISRQKTVFSKNIFRFHPGANPLFYSWIRSVVQFSPNISERQLEIKDVIKEDCDDIEKRRKNWKWRVHTLFSCH